MHRFYKEIFSRISLLHPKEIYRGKRILANLSLHACTHAYTNTHAFIE